MKRKKAPQPGEDQVKVKEALPPFNPFVKWFHSRLYGMSKLQDEWSMWDDTRYSTLSYSGSWIHAICFTLLVVFTQKWILCQFIVMEIVIRLACLRSRVDLLALYVMSEWTLYFSLLYMLPPLSIIGFGESKFMCGVLTVLAICRCLFAPIAVVLYCLGLILGTIVILFFGGSWVNIFRLWCVIVLLLVLAIPNQINIYYPGG